MNIPVVYEDEWLLIADKPSGLLVVPTPKNELRTLTSILNDDIKEKALPYRLYPCHRLDRGTSGLIIYAKGKSAQEKMTGLFKAKSIKKTYIAFVQGRLVRKEGEINKPIEGIHAFTRYKVLGEAQDFSVVEIYPLTGRTNQIRIHFKEVGHPIVGEDKFAFRRDFKLRAKRLCLHAQELQFTHPVTGRPVHVKAALAADMARFLKEHSS